MGMICDLFSVEEELIDTYLADESNYYKYGEPDFFDEHFAYINGKYNLDKTRFITIDKSWKFLQELLRKNDESKEKVLSSAIQCKLKLLQSENYTYHKCKTVESISKEMNKLDKKYLFSTDSIGKLDIHALQIYEIYYEDLVFFFQSALIKKYAVVIRIE